MKFDRDLPHVWLVGGSGKLGLSMAERLEGEYNVTNLSRHAAKENSGSFFNEAIDLNEIPDALMTVQRLLNEAIPRAIVFCQRYRPSSDGDEVDMMSGINTEILSTQRIIEELSGRVSGGRCSIVVISSVNGLFVNNALPFWYHWLKSSQIQLVRYYSAYNCAGMNINCIAAGSFLKDDIAAYAPQHQDWLHRLGQFSPVKENVTAFDIAEIVRFLISEQAAMINGQTITVDGGITNILQETLI